MIMIIDKEQINNSANHRIFSKQKIGYVELNVQKLKDCKEKVNELLRDRFALTSSVSSIGIS